MCFDPVLLGVEERVGHAERHLVPELGRAKRVGVHRGRRACARTISRLRPVDARARALELVERWDGELRSSCPPDADIFDAHLHLGHDIDGMVGDYDQLLELMDDYGISRAFMFCLDEPDRHPAFTRRERPHARVRRALERPADPVRPPRPERVADRGGAPLPRRRRARHQAPPARAEVHADRRAARRRSSSSRPSGACRSSSTAAAACRRSPTGCARSSTATRRRR